VRIEDLVHAMREGTQVKANHHRWYVVRVDVDAEYPYMGILTPVIMNADVELVSHPRYGSLSAKARLDDGGELQVVEETHSEMEW
jgi:hypothetical protein